MAESVATTLIRLRVTTTPFSVNSVNPSEISIYNLAKALTPSVNEYIRHM